jgi:hypothetical protein
MIAGHVIRKVKAKSSLAVQSHALTLAFARAVFGRSYLA